ncbi:hypothetical protein BaRGS_00025151 [Batillaria attramentaria]|uniref:Uncharacterized protein n=1 Tax=Batillaria attramentaria TaxID=370345 RepID=A0ABD0K956_9CAEN
MDNQRQEIAGETVETVKTPPSRGKTDLQGTQLPTTFIHAGTIILEKGLKSETYLNCQEKEDMPVEDDAGCCRVHGVL